ncbi:MAG: glutamate racemase [Thermodesulfovibrionales bacterium]|nr:glutamate racemase [Thermodesulfovibrionales bacterium]
MNMNKKDRPIGVFDSGIGGLTVLKEIMKEMPDEGTIYLGDTARVPYGIRSPETVIRYSFENTRFLFLRDIKLLVVACNTASSVSLGNIKNSIPIPVVGVIEPGAKAAVMATRNKRIGVIGTEATIRSDSYTMSIKAIDRDVEVSGLPCPLFVPLVEEGWTEGDVVTLIAERYLKEIKDKGIDTLVLGCTHYPLLKEVISRVMGEGVRLIDSAVEVAKEIKEILEIGGLKKEHKEHKDKPLREFYVTDLPERFLEIGEKFLGQKIEHIEKISVSS